MYSHGQSGGSQLASRRWEKMFVSDGWVLLIFKLTSFYHKYEEHLNIVLEENYSYVIDIIWYKGCSHFKVDKKGNGSYHDFFSERSKRSLILYGSRTTSTSPSLSAATLSQSWFLELFLNLFSKPFFQFFF